MLIVFVSCCGLRLVFATLQLLLSVLGRVHTVVVIVSSTHHRTPIVNTQQVSPFLARMLQAFVFVLIIVFAHNRSNNVWNKVVIIRATWRLRSLLQLTRLSVGWQ